MFFFFLKFSLFIYIYIFIKFSFSNFLDSILMVLLNINNQKHN